MWAATEDVPDRPAGPHARWAALLLTALGLACLAAADAAPTSWATQHHAALRSPPSTGPLPALRRQRPVAAAPIPLLARHTSEATLRAAVPGPPGPPTATAGQRRGGVRFTAAAFGAAVLCSAALQWLQAGLFRPPSPPLALCAASGEKSTVDALSSLLGETPEPKAEPKTTAAPVAPSGPAIPAEEIAQRLAALPLGDAPQQVAFLDGLGLRKWGSAKGRLDYYPVTMQQLERAGLTAFSLGVVEDEADLDKVKNYTAAVFVGFSALAVVAGFAVPGNTGATLTYVFGAVPLLFMAVGSTAPGIITGAISAIEDGKEGKGGNVDAEGVNRRVRHEAAHFLAGYLLGLPACSYNVEDATARVEFYATARGDLKPRDRFTKEELDRLCVVSLSGAVGEALSFSKAMGGGQDLRVLQGAFVMCNERIDARQQQDMTRWGALKARELLTAYRREYDALCRAFAQRLPVKDCIAAIEAA